MILHAHDIFSVGMKKKDKTHFISIEMLGDYLDECDGDPSLLYDMKVHGIRYGAAGLSDEFYKRISKGNKTD